MYSHITVGTDDIDRARRFYDPVMATLGHAPFLEISVAVAYGDKTGDQFWVVLPYDKQHMTAGNGSHVAFLAKRRADVDAFHAAALANGGSDEGAPGLRPHYHPHYYGAYVRDPEGNKLQACCHHPE